MGPRPKATTSFGMHITGVYTRISRLVETFVPALGRALDLGLRLSSRHEPQIHNGQRPLRRLSANWPTALCFSVSSSLASLVNAASPGHRPIAISPPHRAASSVVLHRGVWCASVGGGLSLALRPANPLLGRDTRIQQTDQHCRGTTPRRSHPLPPRPSTRERCALPVSARRPAGAVRAADDGTIRRATR
jgi:hypothetical protein